MITYKITGDSMFVNDTVRGHIEKHFSTFEKFNDGGNNAEVGLTISKVTAHHHEGAFRVEVKLHLRGKDYFVYAENADITNAVDEAKESLMREVTSAKDRKQTLFHRGARKLKKMLKGLKNK